MRSTTRLLAAAAATAVSLGAATLHARERAAAVPPLPRYQQECGSCHIAFPPALLPASSWQRLVGGLSQHFGTDASVEAEVTAELNAWLTANAARHSFADEPPPEDRITRSARFLRKHRAVSPGVWKRAAVGAPSNCAACHRDAARGRFDEDSVTIPKEVNR
jgi:hypothetical protein